MKFLLFVDRLIFKVFEGLFKFNSLSDVRFYNRLKTFWKVNNLIISIVSGEEKDLVFDAVLVCTGHHASVNKPTFPGLDK